MFKSEWSPRQVWGEYKNEYSGVEITRNNYEGNENERGEHMEQGWIGGAWMRCQNTCSALSRLDTCLEFRGRRMDFKV